MGDACQLFFAKKKLYLQKLLHACKKTLKTCAAGSIQFVDAGVGQNFGEHVADLILQNGVYVVCVQFRMAGEDALGPLGVLLQLFGVLGSGGAGDQYIGQLGHFLLQAAGQNGQTHDLDEADIFLFDMVQFCVRVEHAQRVLLGGDVIAQHQIQLIFAVPHPGDGGDGVVRLAVGLGKDEARFVR